MVGRFDIELLEQQVATMTTVPGTYILECHLSNP